MIKNKILSYIIYVKSFNIIPLFKVIVQQKSKVQLQQFWLYLFMFESQFMKY